MGHGTNETSYGSASPEAVGDNHGLDHPRYGDSPSVHTRLCVLHYIRINPYVTHLCITVCSVSILIIITYITRYVCSVTIFRLIITYITHYVCSVTIFELVIITYITLYVCSVIITYITLYVCSVI